MKRKRIKSERGAKSLKDRAVSVVRTMKKERVKLIALCVVALLITVPTVYFKFLRTETTPTPPAVGEPTVVTGINVVVANTYSMTATYFVAGQINAQIPYIWVRVQLEYTGDNTAEFSTKDYITIYIPDGIYAGNIYHFINYTTYENQLSGSVAEFFLNPLDVFGSTIAHDGHGGWVLSTIILRVTVRYTRFQDTPPIVQEFENIIAFTYWM